MPESNATTKGTLAWLDIAKVSLPILSAVLGAYIAVTLQIASLDLREQVTQQAVNSQDQRIGQVAREVNGVSTTVLKLQEHVASLGELLYEKRIIRTPHISANTSIPTDEPEDMEAPKRTNKFVGALKATGHGFAKIGRAIADSPNNDQPK